MFWQQLLPFRFLADHPYPEPRHIGASLSKKRNVVFCREVHSRFSKDPNTPKLLGGPQNHPPSCRPCRSPARELSEAIHVPPAAANLPRPLPTGHGSKPQVATPSEHPIEAFLKKTRPGSTLPQPPKRYHYWLMIFTKPNKAILLKYKSPGRQALERFREKRVRPLISRKKYHETSKNWGEKHEETKSKAPIFAGWPNRALTPHSGM